MAILQPIVDLMLDLLKFFQGYVGDYGLAIILLTVSVRVVLLPLTLRQMQSMQAMKELAPQIKKLQEKHKDDKQKQQEEVLKFYKDNKVNPLSGCLPLILQFPILIALYRALSTTNLLDNKPFLIFIADLTKSAGTANLTAAEHLPLIILVVLMAATTFMSQKMVSTDPQQDKMMLMMGGFMAFIAWNLPAGVLLYWITANVLQMLQQVAMARLTKQQGES